MLSLNQIKYKLISYFEAHGQINQVVYADDFEFNAQRNLNYPVTNIEYVDATINNKFLNYTFKIVIGDRVVADDTNQQDNVHSDAILIAEDFFAYLQQEEGWTFNKSSSIQKFLDDSGDRVSGIVFRITLAVIRSQNTCQTPVKIS
jgi:hypothetical protein